MFIAMSMIPAGDLAGKLLTESGAATPVFVAWSRFAIGTALLLPLVSPSAYGLLRDWRIWLRSLLIAGGILSIQTALRTEPIADVFAAFFVGPIISYALSAVFLREKVTPLRTVLMLAGFCGVLLVVRPGFGGSAGLLWAVLAGAFYGAYLTASRWLADRGTPLALIYSQLIVSAVVLAPAGLAALPPLTGSTMVLTVASAGFSMTGNLLLLYAYSRAPASHLAPLVYFQLIAATALGWVAYQDLPDALTWAGLALIIGSGLASAGLRR
ncbi:MAG: DMT family transporter [Pseudomonadota bacterium]